MSVTIGLVGVGRIGLMHARNLAQLDDVRLVLTDLDVQRARATAAGLGAEFVPSIDALLGTSLDGLVVAVGTAAHPQLIRAGVESGIPVFCEKPVAMTVADSLPLLDWIKVKGGVVQIGHQRRFDAGYLEARRAFRAGELGWLHAIQAVTCDAQPPPVGFLATSGGLFRDVSVHDFDVIRWVTGQEIVEVYARGSNNGDPAIAAVGDVDSALAVLTLADGTHATVTASRYNGAGHDVRMTLQGSMGSLEVGLDAQAALRSAEAGVSFPGGRAHRDFAERFSSAYQAEMRAFVELIHGDRANPCPPEDAVAASHVADAAQESLAAGVAVALSPTPAVVS